MRLQDMLTLYFANRSQGSLLILRRKDLFTPAGTPPPLTRTGSPSSVRPAFS